MLKSLVMNVKITLPSPAVRTAVSFFVPPLVALIIQSSVRNLIGAQEQSDNVLFLGALGVLSLLMGLVWYGADGMALRGKRPFFASAGFAFLGWVALLILRLTVDTAGLAQGGLLVEFIYLLLFEAFAVQLWLFGFFFRSMSDWRGPLSGALMSGLLFGAAGFLLFNESYEATAPAALYFMAWGLFYGLIRLRTGSILGLVIVQAMQSLTAWHILLPNLPPQPDEYFYLHIGMTVWLAVLIWRLWPNEEGDYRV